MLYIKIGTFKQHLRKGLVRWPEVFCSRHASMPQVQSATTAVAVKTSLFKIKFIDWPYCASWIRRRSWRAVVSTTLSIQFYFTSLEHRCIFDRYRIARYTHFILFWSSLEISELTVHFSIMSLKFRCQARHPLSEKYSQIYTQNTVDGKEDFITDIIAPRGVNKTASRKPAKRRKEALSLPMNRPFLWKFFFTFPCRGGSLYGFNRSQTFDKVRDLE